MGQTSTKPDHASGTPPDKSTVLFLLGTLADTTWRMFVPPLVGGLIGWWGDLSWHLFPWLSLVGVGVGCVVTAFFIRDLLKR